MDRVANSMTGIWVTAKKGQENPWTRNSSEVCCCPNDQASEWTPIQRCNVTAAIIINDVREQCESFDMCL